MNPWLTIPLADYEGHMGSSDVDQSSLLAEVLSAALLRHRPTSLVVLGCAGGNGFDQIDPMRTREVVAIDINDEYSVATRTRYESKLAGLRVLTMDIQTDALPDVAADLVHAGLILEYVDVSRIIPKIAGLIARGGLLHTVLQLPSDKMAAVSATGFTSLQRLSSTMRLVPPAELIRAAGDAGLVLQDEESVQSRAGKTFAVLTFGRS